jgi:DNA polymerase-3 subunit gamma/tau
VRTLETLGQAVVDMRGTDAADPRLVLEIALVRLARRDAGPPLQALAERVDRLEKQVGGVHLTPSTAPAMDSGKAGPTKTIGARRREKAARADDPAVPEVVQSEPAPDPEPEPEPVAESEPADAPPVEIDDVILAWSDLLTALPRATKAVAEQAQPLSIDGSVITFGVPKGHLANAKPRFQKEADTIRDALSSRLGRRMLFKLVAHDGFDAEPNRATARGAPAPDDEHDPGDDIDLTELVDAGRDDTAVDSVSVIARRLDATVVEERPRN